MTPPPLSAAARVRFALWFCRHDLFECVARRVSVAVIAAVALAVFAAVFALAVPSVAAQVRLTRLAERPLARCVWVFADLGEKFTPTRLSALEMAARDSVPPGAAVTVTGFHDVTFEFVERDGVKLLPRRGRTVGPADELLPAVPDLVRAGPGFDGPAAAGVILSPALVERLGWNPDDPPAEVQIRLPKTLRPVAWRVAGVTREPLPLGHDFLLTEAEDDRLLKADPDRRRKVIWSGPVGAGWPTSWGQFPDAVRGAVDRWRLQAAVRPRLVGRVVQLVSDYPRPESEWRLYLGQIHDLMRRDRAEAPGFVAVESDEPAADTPVESRRDYPKATIYVRDLAHLGPAADAARGLDLYANDANRVLVDEIETTAARARAVAAVLVLLFCAAGALALWLALYLRGHQKLAQVGMLRAMGATDRVLRTAVVVEAGLLWAAGAAFGLATAAAVAVVLCRHYAVTAAEFRAAVGGGWWATAVGGFLAASLVGCVAANLAATRGVRRRPAAESLGLTS